MEHIFKFNSSHYRDGPSLLELYKVILLIDLPWWNVLKGRKFHQVLVDFDYEFIRISYKNNKSCQIRFDEIPLPIKSWVKVMYAVAVFQNKLGGNVKFSQSNPDAPVKIRGKIIKLSQGKHGFHIHHYGDLLLDCASCGDHWNPTHKQHGGRRAKNSHAGDLGNITSNENRESRFHFSTDKITLFGKNSIIGRSIIIHKDQDDLGKGDFPDSLTTGHSGKRLDCAVIGISKRKRT